MESKRTDELNQATEVALRLMAAIFDPDDTILFRPIESWTENGRKRSRVDFKRSCYWRARSECLLVVLPQLLATSRQNQTNLYFGVSPRFGRDGEYDLAWQIRVVRCLWIDIDHVTTEEATARIVAAGLPEPSIVVNSGNGAHLYWLLDEPYLIDDVADPLQVKKEWIELPGGRKKPKSYVIQDGEKVYLDGRGHLFQPSGKAQRLQNVLSGVAHKCGGDHTHDLSRLMRIAGSWNCKDQRNGKEPVPTALVKCDPGLKYPISLFDPFAKVSPVTERQKKIAGMPLPKERVKISDRNSNTLSDHIAICSIAAAGARSEVDFKLCCFAIKNGIGKEHVWNLVQNTGKFGEGGSAYFDRTWNNAEIDVQAKKLDELEINLGGITGERTSEHDATLETGTVDPTRPDSVGKDVIHVDPTTTQVGDTLHSVTNVLLGTKTCFTRSGQLASIEGDDVSSILSSVELAGFLNQHVEFFFVAEEGGEYKPLPPAYGNTWLNNHLEQKRLPKSNFVHEKSGLHPRLASCRFRV